MVCSTSIVPTGSEQGAMVSRDDRCLVRLPRLRPAKRPLATLFALVATVLACSSVGTFVSSAQEVAKDSHAGNWTIYCTKSVAKRSIHDCSMVTALVAESDSGRTLKVGLAYTSDATDMEMRLRIPRTNYFQKGISISTELGHIGRAFVKRCDDAGCETSVPVDMRLLTDLIKANLASFEYQITDEESIALSLDLRNLVPALAQLRKSLGFEAEISVAQRPIVTRILGVLGYKTKASDTSYVVQLKSNPYAMYFAGPADLLNPYHAFGEPLDQCNGTAAKTEVKVTVDLKVRDDAALKSWLDDTQACAAEAVFWISRKDVKTPQYVGLAVQEHLGELALFELLKDRVPTAVVTDQDTNVPLVPFRSP